MANYTHNPVTDISDSDIMKLYPNLDLPKTPWRTYSHLMDIRHLQATFAA